MKVIETVFLFIFSLAFTGIQFAESFSVGSLSTKVTPDRRVVNAHNKLQGSRSSTSQFDLDIAVLETIRKGVEEKGWWVQWQECVETLMTKAQLSSEQAEVTLAKTFDWLAWAKCDSPLMRKWLQPKEPDGTKLEKSLDWLTSGPLSMSTDQMQKALLQCPAIYLLEPAISFEKALQCAPAEFSTMEAFQAECLTFSSALQNTYNCANGDDGCASNCGNCWVTYLKS
jgi:hypothetical protein